jgi:hypothetical protein
VYSGASRLLLVQLSQLLQQQQQQQQQQLWLSHAGAQQGSCVTRREHALFRAAAWLVSTESRMHGFSRQTQQQQQQQQLLATVSLLPLVRPGNVIIYGMYILQTIRFV